MEVKCRCCGKKIPKENAFSVKTGKANTYYCSENEYNEFKIKKNKDSHMLDELRYYFSRAMGFQTKQLIGPVLHSIKELQGEYDDMKLLDLLETNWQKYEALSEKCSMDDQGWKRSKYILSIIRTDAAFYKEKQEDKTDLNKVLGLEDYNLVSVNKKVSRRKGFTEL